ncbi:MAG TPA: hypothetical protein VK028_09770 [Micromonosporaceae bacterium]|nr:hypothetical protein [Micromonosporaceae bacterium]
MAVEVAVLVTAEEPGFALVVRTGWAALRVIGFLVLMRAVRLGRAAARPFGLILAITTVFAVARLAQPRTGGLLPNLTVLVGLGVLAGLCAAVVWQLYRSPAVAAHLAARPARRQVPGWVLTARVAVLAYGALLLVPLLVAVGTVAGATANTGFGDGATGIDRGLSLAVAWGLLAVWFVIFLVVGFTVPLGSFFLVLGKRWARWWVGGLSVVVLIAQPVLCYALLGLDGLLRDGVPMVLTALIALYALHRSRGLPVHLRPGSGTPPSADAAREPA